MEWEGGTDRRAGEHLALKIPWNQGVDYIKLQYTSLFSDLFPTITTYFTVCGRIVPLIQYISLCADVVSHCYKILHCLLAYCPTVTIYLTACSRIALLLQYTSLCAAEFTHCYNILYSVRTCCPTATNVFLAENITFKIHLIKYEKHERMG